MKIKITPSLFKRVKAVFILTIIPIFFTFVFGTVLSHTYVEHIPIGVLDLDQSSVSRSIIDMLEDSEGLDVTCHAASLPELEEMLLRGEIYGGLILPDDFEKDLRRSESPGALVLVDYSNLLIGNNITAYANVVFNTVNAGLSMNIMQAGEIVPYVAEQSVATLTFVERMLYDPRASYFLYLFIIILSILIQQPYLSVIAPLFVEEKQRLRSLSLNGAKVEARRLAKEILLYACCSLLGAFASLSVAHHFFGFPWPAHPLLVVLLQVIFLFSLTAIAILFGAIFEDTAHCGQLIMLLSIPAILFSGYAWPEFMMERWFSALVHAFWPIFYFINPLKDLCIKGVGFVEIQDYVTGGLAFALIWTLAALGVYTWRTRKVSRCKTDGQPLPDFPKQID